MRQCSSLANWSAQHAQPSDSLPTPSHSKWPEVIRDLDTVRLLERAHELAQAARFAP